MDLIDKIGRDEIERYNLFYQDEELIKVFKSTAVYRTLANKVWYNDSTNRGRTIYRCRQILPIEVIKLVLCELIPKERGLNILSMINKCSDLKDFDVIEAIIEPLREKRLFLERNTKQLF